MENIDKETQDYLDKMGPTYHMSLLHHHNITCKLNNITDPIDDYTLITFTNPDGSEYNIHWKTLNERAKAEQDLFIQQQNGNK